MDWTGARYWQPTSGLEMASPDSCWTWSHSISLCFVCVMDEWKLRRDEGIKITKLE